MRKEQGRVLSRRSSAKSRGTSQLMGNHRRSVASEEMDMSFLSASQRPSPRWTRLPADIEDAIRKSRPKYRVTPIKQSMSTIDHNGNVRSLPARIMSIIRRSPRIGKLQFKLWQYLNGSPSKWNNRGVVHKKILVHSQKKSGKSEKSKDFFEDLKSVNLIWGWTTPRIKCLNPFSFIKSWYTKKNFEKSEKSEKSKKNQKQNLRNFWGFKIRIPYFGVNKSSRFSV